MFEENRTVAKRNNLRAKPFGVLSLISMLALAATCLSGSVAMARSSLVNNAEQVALRRANREAYETK